MKITLYDHADDFLKDNKKIIESNSLKADLMYGNAHSSLGKEDRFFGASVKDNGESLLSIQILPYARVHFSDCKNPEPFTDALVESYIEQNNVPDDISGDKKTMESLVNAFKKHGIEYALHFDMLKRKCETLAGVPVLDLKLMNAETIDFDFTDFYINFADDCSLDCDPDTAREKAAALKLSGNLFALVDNGSVVTMAATSRKTHNARAVNFVYTPPEHRGKGYSLCCVKQLTEAILKDNDCAFLYADINNPISNHVYEKLGYEVFDEFCHYKKL
ncbi:MAG: GNAT family N-acetyltransferase [Clostridia bacterium]|nr:GNAT family N-acetyltransferase [Clostridia bacterium]